jgi:hypothetical protein
MIIIPAQLESFRSLKDRTLKISFETHELSPSAMGDIQDSLGKIGFLAFKPDPFKENEKQLIDSLEAEYTDTSKTPSQRLRGVLWHNFNKDPEGYKTFPAYYENKLEQLINHFKSKLD